MAALGPTKSDYAKTSLKVEVDDLLNRLCQRLRSLSSPQAVEDVELKRSKIQGRLDALKDELETIDQAVESIVVPQTVAIEFQTRLDDRLRVEDDGVAGWARQYWHEHLRDIGVEARGPPSPSTAAQDESFSETDSVDSTLSDEIWVNPIHTPELPQDRGLGTDVFLMKPKVKAVRSQHPSQPHQPTANPHLTMDDVAGEWIFHPRDDSHLRGRQGYYVARCRYNGCSESADGGPKYFPQFALRQGNPLQTHLRHKHPSEDRDRDTVLSWCLFQVKDCDEARRARHNEMTGPQAARRRKLFRSKRLPHKLVQ